MATVNKNFKIKSGLVVEGSTATVAGYDLLKKSAADDQYIIDLIGGETLVKSVSNEFDVSVAGQLSIDRAVVDAYYDAAGDAADALTDANAYTDGRETAITNAYEAYADQAEVDAKAYTDSRETAITDAYQTYANTAEADAVTAANAYTDTRETAITTAYQIYANTAESDAITIANAYTDSREGIITDAYEAYADQAEVDAKAYADQKVADLVDSAPELLDTLNELAAAIGDNPNYATDLATSVGTKVSKAGDTMTGLLVLSADPSANLGAATKQYVDQAETDAVASAATYTDGRETAITTAYESYADQAEVDAKAYADSLAVNYDVAGAAAQALSDAEDYADALDTDDIAEGTAKYFTDARAKTSAADLLTGASLTNITITGTGAGLTITAENGVADSNTDQLAEGTTNKYFTDARAVTALEAVVPNFTAVEVNSVAKQVAATATVATAGTNNAITWAKADYRSAEFLVNINDGSHTQVSKVVLTLDASDNIAITEYAVVNSGSSSIATVSAEISGSNVALTVTTVNNASDVSVVGTLLK